MPPKLNIVFTSVLERKNTSKIPKIRIEKIIFSSALSERRPNERRIKNGNEAANRISFENKCVTRRKNEKIFFCKKENLFLRNVSRSGLGRGLKV